jgi:phosphoadenosine phosphosulfate reductase
MLPDFEHAHPREVLEWAFATFGDRIALSTAFGSSGVALMHLASQVRPGARVFFVDTGFHFEETLEMVNRISDALPLRIEVRRPKLSVMEQARAHGPALYSKDPDACCAIRKVEPTREMLGELDAWITALRRDQGASRANTAILERKPQPDGRVLLKVNPLARWTRREVWHHIFQHDLPYNPLHDRGYPSVGCWPCTRAVSAHEDERAGRWAGSVKTECGLHTVL